MPNTGKPSNFKTILLIILIVLSAGAGFILYNNSKKTEHNAAISLQQEQKKWQEKIDNLEKTDSIQGEISNQENQPKDLQPPTSSESANQLTGNNIVIDPCKDIPKRIDAFFARLDNEGYIIDLNLEGGSKAYFSEIIKKILTNKPDITRETDNLLSVLQNAAHFYRVLGEKNIFILKKIIALEKGQLEPVLADFFSLFLNGDECQDVHYPIQLPMENMYSYSTFFLNTLGGQAYLYRRDPSFRCLIKYYSVLVMDQANMRNANPLGVDIRYPINSLIEELSTTTTLEGRDKYLNNLLELKRKYEKLYGN